MEIIGLDYSKLCLATLSWSPWRAILLDREQARKAGGVLAFEQPQDFRHVLSRFPIRGLPAKPADRALAGIVRG